MPSLLLSFLYFHFTDDLSSPAPRSDPTPADIADADSRRFESILPSWQKAAALYREIIRLPRECSPAER